MNEILDSSPIVLGLSLVISVFLWAEGYKLYRLAVFFLGFIVGFTVSGGIIKLIPSFPAQAFIAQIICGVVLGALSFIIIKLGFFVGAACAVFMVTNSLLKPLGTIGMVIAFASAVVAGFVATKADEPVIILLTSIAGGFMIPAILLRIIMLTPYDVSFLPRESSVVWLIVKIVLSAVGAGIQFAKKKADN